VDRFWLMENLTIGKGGKTLQSTMSKKTHRTCYTELNDMNYRTDKNIELDRGSSVTSSALLIQEAITVMLANTD
jgi:hypothetical protein